MHLMPRNMVLLFSKVAIIENTFLLIYIMQIEGVRTLSLYVVYTKIKYHPKVKSNFLFSVIMGIFDQLSAISNLQLDRYRQKHNLKILYLIFRNTKIIKLWIVKSKMIYRKKFIKKCSAWFIKKYSIVPTIMLIIFWDPLIIDQI